MKNLYFLALQHHSFYFRGAQVWIVDNPSVGSALSAEDPLDTNPYIDSTNTAPSGSGGIGVNAANDLGLLDASARSELGAGSGGVASGGDAEEAEGESRLLLRCIHILWGHEAPITAVAISSELDLAVSGAANGPLLVHRVQV